MPNKSYKGRKFEIWLAKTLSEWWSGGKRDDLLWHTHDSGGRATKRLAKGKKTTGLHGDICAVDLSILPLLDVFTIEAKNGYSKFSVADLLDKPGDAVQMYEKWLTKAIASQRAAGSLYWLLIVKRDKREPLVFFPEAFADNLPDVTELLALGTRWTMPVRLAGVEVDVVAVTLACFLQAISPATIRRLARET